MPSLDLSISPLHQAFAEGLTPSALLETIEARIQAVDDPGIFISRPDADLVQSWLDELGPLDPQQKPLWGVPFAVKDNIDVAGMETTAACPAYGYKAKENATVVDRLIEAGALMIGKTNLDQFATGLVGVRTPYPVPKNALHPELIPGGSSAGSAVAVAKGLCTFALGTDTAGSGRIPAGLNGLVGLKPSLGALSTKGVVPACRTLDCVSIFANDVDNAVRAFHVARGYDDEDSYSRPMDWPKPRAIKRIGVPRVSDRIFFDDQIAEAAFATNLNRMAGLGVEIVEIPFAPFYETAKLLYEGPWVAERYAAIEDFIREQPSALHPVTMAIIGKAIDATAVDAFKAMYRLKDLQHIAAKVLEDLDGLCVPTAPTWYSLEQVKADPIGTNSNLGTYTNFVNLLGLCGLTLPMPPQSDGLPSSITLLATDGRDGDLTGLAQKL